MKIVQCSFGDGYAGSAKMAILSSEQLMKKGHDVIMYVSRNSLTEKRSVERNIPTVSFDTEKEKKLLFADIGQTFMQNIPEYFIAYHSLDRKAGIYLKQKFKKKFINVASRQNITKSAPIIGSFIYNRYYDYQIACSKGVGKSLERSGIKRSKIIVINNCIEVADNLDKISGEGIRKSLPSNKIILGLSTWFHKERKGFDILFKAFSGLDDNYVILIVGIPEKMQNDVLNYASEFGIAKEKIIMPGYIEYIWEYYKAMDIFLLPSRSEGFSLALLEAGAVGLPVIASNIPGTDELIKNGENGFLFEIEKPEGLCDAITKLSGDEKLKAKFGGALQKEVLWNYMISNYADRLEEFLFSVK
jgi:glycosyltransferase involved in cell wall biosynthesis